MAAEQRAFGAAIAAQDCWVLDSAYGGWRDLVLARAELVVALDYPRWLSLSRLVRRTARTDRDRAGGLQRKPGRPWLGCSPRTP